MARAGVDGRRLLYLSVLESAVTARSSVGRRLAWPRQRKTLRPISLESLPPRMMNRYESPRSGGEARVRYLDGEIQVVVPGAFVRCAVTGQPILIDELKYWSVELQEPYVDAAASMARFRQIRGL